LFLLLFLSTFATVGSPITNYSVRLGGAAGDFPTAVTADANGIAYVTGYTYSTNFPGASPRVGPNDPDIFVTKIGGNGEIVWSVVLGGTAFDYPAAIASDPAGNVYVTGQTSSTNFPTLNAFQPVASSNGSAFVLKLTMNGALAYSSYLGSNGYDVATAIAVTTNTGEAVVVGASSPRRDIFGTQSLDLSTSDIFVVRVGPQGTNITLSTVLRGSQYDNATAVSVDSFNNIYVAGSTLSADFPATPGAYRTESLEPGHYDIFVTKLGRSNGALLYSTFLGVPTFLPVALEVDANGAVYVAGTDQLLGFEASRGTSDFLPKPPAVEPILDNAFLARLSPSGSQLTYIRRYGTSGLDGIRALKLDSAGSLRMAGFLGSHLFTGRINNPANDPGPGFSSSFLPFTYCGDEAHHLFSFAPIHPAGNLYHVAGFDQDTPRLPGTPPREPFFRFPTADAVASSYAVPPWLTNAPVVSLSLLNDFEDRLSSNEVIYVRVDGGDIDGRPIDVTVFSGSETIATFDGVPRLLALTNLPPGQYTLTATAVNSNGVGFTSCPLSFTVVPAPPNDQFYRATHISGTSYATNTTLVGASVEPIEPADLNVYSIVPLRSLWWCWTAPVSGPFTAEAFGEQLSTELAVYVGPNLGELTPVVSADIGSNVLAAFKATAGTHYFFRVTGRGATGPLSFRLRAGNPPSNDDFANRLALTGANFAINANNFDATRETSVLGDDAYSPASVWWRWTAPAAGRYLIAAHGDGLYLALSVYRVTNGAALPSQFEPRVTFDAVAGEQFDIRAAGSGGTMGNFTLSISDLVAPSNDNFSSAAPLAGLPVAVNGTMVGATLEENEPGWASASVWYRWTAPSAGAAEATVTLPSQARLSVYTGTTLSNLTLVAEAYPSEPVVFRVEASQHYYICVRNYFGNEGEFTLTVNPGSAPTNDDFAAAASISGSAVSVLGSNAGATLQPGEPSSLPHSVWYRWVAPSNALYTIAVEGFEDFLVTPYTGTSLSNLVRAVIATPDSSYKFSARFFGNKGTTYYLSVSSRYRGDLFRMRIRPAAPPPNDNFANRAALSGETMQISASTVDATIEAGEPVADSQANGSVWYSWTAPASRKMVMWLPQAYEYRLQVFSGTTLGALSPIGIPLFFSPELMFDAEAGQTYAIQITSQLDATIQLNLAPLVPPPNDHFTNAFVLTGTLASATGVGLGATSEPGEPGNFYTNSIWWKWTAPASGRVRILPSSPVVYSGNSIDSLTIVSTVSWPAVTFLAGTGETYYIRVSSWSVRPFQMILAATLPPPSPQLESMRRLANGAFELQFDAIMGQTNVIDASTDLFNWIPIATNFLDCGVLNVLDPAAVGFPQRFYRLRAP
jgi:hypothetical protein